MVYNNEIKKWEHAGGSQGISQVQVFHDHVNSSYRIVGRKGDTNEVIIFCIFICRSKICLHHTASI